MATTKIWPVKCSIKKLLDYAANPNKTSESDLDTVIGYAMNGDKIASKYEKTCYVSGVNCSADNALEEMLSIQRLFGKTGGNVAYHCYQSFRPGEITPEECHRLGVELAKGMWGADYQVIVATHLDREHLHNHLVCNAVSLIDGKKFNCNKAAYRKLRKLSDEICRESGYSVIEKPMGKTPRQIYFAEKNGEPTKYNLMRAAIDDCIACATSYKEFIYLMRICGYEIDARDNRKYPTIRSAFSSKNTRMYRLGEDYELHRIYERIDENRIEGIYRNRDCFRRTYLPPSKSRGYVNGPRKNARKIGGLRGLYYKYCYLMGYLPKPTHRPLSPEMREAMRWCDKASESARLLAHTKIDTIEGLKRFIDASKSEINVLSQERNKIYNRIRRAKDSKAIRELKEKRNTLTDRISSIRKDLKTADFILGRSEKVVEEIQIEQRHRCGEHLRQRERTRGNRDLER